MFTKTFLFIFLYFVWIAEAAPDIKQVRGDCSMKVQKCETSGNARRPVCGSDGQTYPTRCHVFQAQCSGMKTDVAYKGPCHDTSEDRSACRVALEYALKAHGPRRAKYVPRCRADGTYAPIQCGDAAAGCWCVNPAGKPLPNTAVTNGRPDCSKTGKSHTRRRSSVRGQRNKKNCNRSDRSLFNANLLKIFSGEHERARSGEVNTSVSTTDPLIVVEWKFKELDRDHNGALQKPEYRGLRRLIKKVVKPKRCARAWIRGCDGDANSDISRTEWSACLLSTPAPPAPDYVEGAGAEPSHDYGEEELPLDPTSVLPGSLMRGAVAAEGSDMDSRRDDDNNDCLTDQQAVLDEQKAGGSALYVPECTGDGRYARAQCYNSTGYCWCVHQDTGKPIPGSSVKDRRPDCDNAPHHASPMRGCPEPKKSKFLRDLRHFFITKMLLATNSSGPGAMTNWSASREESAATWVFVMLDKNKDKVLERREWKSFHHLISSVEELKRCGRKLPRYCDVNHDVKISITEWLACLDVVMASTTTPTDGDVPKPHTHSRRKGPNPLESILKADD